MNTAQPVISCNYSISFITNQIIITKTIISFSFCFFLYTGQSTVNDELDFQINKEHIDPGLQLRMSKRDQDQKAECKCDRTRRRAGKSPCGKNPFLHVHLDKREAKTPVAPKANFDLITTTNWEFVDMTENWLESLRRFRYQI